MIAIIIPKGEAQLVLWPGYHQRSSPPPPPPATTLAVGPINSLLRQTRLPAATSVTANVVFEAGRSHPTAT
jgi:hypothetical protein